MPITTYQAEKDMRAAWGTDLADKGVTVKDRFPPYIVSFLSEWRKFYTVPTPSFLRSEVLKKFGYGSSETVSPSDQHRFAKAHFKIRRHPQHSFAAHPYIMLGGQSVLGRRWCAW